MTPISAAGARPQAGQASAFVPKQIEPERRIMAGNPGVTAVFGDDTWDLSAADYHGAREDSQTVIEFGWVPFARPLLKQALKELAYHRLNTRVSGTAKPVGVYTAAREQLRLRRFVRWIEHYHPDVSSLRDITQTIVHAYRCWLENPANAKSLPTVKFGRHSTSGTAKTDPSTVWAYLGPIKSLDEVREHLSVPMQFRPYDGELSGGFVGWLRTPGENSTEPVSEDMLRAMVSTSLRYIDHYAADIEAMVQEMLAHQAARMHALGAAAPIPFCFQSPISTCPVLERPWRKPFGEEAWDYRFEYRTEFRHAVAACLVLILYLSGMRSGEIAMLGQKCLQEVRDPHSDEVVRWKVVGVAEKKRTKHTAGVVKPKIVEWVVPEPAARAIKLLKTLYAPFRERSGSDRLLLNLDVLYAGAKPDSDGFPMTVTAIRSALRSFQDMIRVRFGDMPDGYAAPMQFRRTLARHIARQPFGIIAGKLQYKHVSTIVFEGYAGDPDSGFRTELSEEQVLANIDLMDELEADAEQGNLYGPGAGRLLQNIRAARGEAAKAWIDASKAGIEATAALRSVAINLHLGVLNLCAFDPAQPERALCLSAEEKRRADGPKLAMCSPAECPNSVIGACHVAKWRELLEDGVALKAQARSTPQRASLERQIKSYRRVLKLGPDE